MVKPGLTLITASKGVGDTGDEWWRTDVAADGVAWISRGAKRREERQADLLVCL